jgi:nitrous oxide reductase accessory protein NosL
MKRGILSVLFVACILTIGGAAFGDDDIQKDPSCKFCGMNRAMFAHSRMVVEYDDGTSLGTCSIHCMAIELALNIDKTPRALLVGDFDSKKLIDAEKAFWVMGGKRPGVMTKRAKWAFENQADAEKFIAENGGTLSTFDEVMKATYEDMYADTKMIRENRKKMKK